jgi:hypothetical protein
MVTFGLNLTGLSVSPNHRRSPNNETEVYRSPGQRRRPISRSAGGLCYYNGTLSAFARSEKHGSSITSDPKVTISRVYLTETNVALSR